MLGERRPLRWIILLITMLVALPGGADASLLHWVSKLGYTTCDNHPVIQNNNQTLTSRPEHPDLDEERQFEAERPFTSDSTLKLIVCNGEVHVHPSAVSDRLRITVRLGFSLGHELTPKSFLQVFSVEARGADIEWKLPERVKPVIDIYVPKETNLDLRLGKTELDVENILGDKTINAGKGCIKLAVGNGQSDYRSLTVDISMGSFADRRPGGTPDDHVPLHKELFGPGRATARLHMAMGRIELTQE